MKNGPYELIVPPPEYPGKRYRGKYAYEHRVEWWKATGENPDDFPNHVVHHKNDKKRDNSDNNLELIPRDVHDKYHGVVRSLESITLRNCLHCNGVFVKRRSSTHKFCSRRCIGLYNFPRRKLENFPV